MSFRDLSRRVLRPVRQIPWVVAWCGLTGGAIAAQDAGSPQHEDLDYLSERIQLIHAAPTDSAAKQAFQRHTEELRQRLDGMDPVTFALEIARLTASLGDAHTRLLLGSIEPSLRSLPVQLGLFSEGVVIIATTEAHRDLAGASVLRIGRLDVRTALERLGPLVSFENESWFRQAAPRRLATAEILHHIDAVDDVERIDLRVSRNGVEQDVRLDVLPPDAEPQWIDARTSSNLAALRHRQPGVKHWFEAVPGRRALYFQYDEVADDGPRSVAATAAALEREFGDRAYERLIVDLRENGGGNNLLNRDLLQALVRMPDLDETGRLVVLIGRGTFSAGTMFALDLEYHFNPVFIGEPTGGSPNFFAEPTIVTLPNSGLEIFCATAMWQYSDPRDRRSWIAPLVSVEPSWEAEQSGRDAALEAALDWTPERGLATLLQEALDAGGFPHLAETFDAFVRDPRHRWFTTEGALTTLGFRMLGAERLSEAVEVFELNASEHPGSVAAHANLGRAYLRAGDRTRALEEYQRARAIDPTDPRTLAAVERLTAP